MKNWKINRINHFKNVFWAALLCQILLSCKPTVKEFGPGGKLSDSKEVTLKKATVYQGVSFGLTGEESGPTRPRVRIRGSFDEQSDFFALKGDYIAIDEGTCDSRPISDFKYYDYSGKFLDFDISANIRTFRLHHLKIGIYKDEVGGKRLLKCLDSAEITYLYHPEAPGGFSSVQNSGYYSSTSVSFASFQAGVTHVQLFSDSECSREISPRQNATYQDVRTKSLPLGKHKIYARVWSDEVASPCSTHFLNYHFKLEPVEQITLTTGSSPSFNPTPVLRLSQTFPEGKVQLFLDSACTQAASVQRESSGTVTNMPTDKLPTGDHTIYAKLWNSEDIPSECSTAFFSYTVLGPQTVGSSASTSNTASIKIPNTSAGGYAQLFSDSSCTQAISSRVSTAAGGTTLSTNALATGKYQIHAKIWDSGGVASCSQNFAAYTVLVSPVTSIVSQSGSASANATPSFQISPAVSSGKAQLFLDSACTRAASAKVSTSGTTANLVTNALAPGAIKIYAKVEDSQGSASACSTSFASYTLYSPIKTITSRSGARGVDTTPTFQISPTVAGTKAQLFSDSICTRALSPKVSASGTATTITTNMLSLGAVKIYARIEDSRGHASSCSASFAGYTVSPSAVNSIASQSGSKGVDTTPGFRISPTVSGGKAQLFSNSSCTRAISGKMATSGSSATVTTNTLPAGTVSVYAGVEDSQGNASACSTVSATYTVLLSTTVSLVSLSGTEGVDTTPSFKVTPTIAGGRAQLFSDANCTQSLSGQVSTSGTATTITTKILSFGVKKVYAKIWDGKNNASQCSPSSVNYTVLISPPSGQSIVASTKKTATPSIQVTGLQVGGQAQLFSDSSCSASLSAKISVTKETQNLVTTPLASGTWSLYVKAWDSQGNVSSCAMVYANYTYLSVPAKISIISKGSTPTVGVSGLFVGGKVQLFSDAACSTSLSQKVSVTKTTQSLATNTLGPGTYSIYAKAWDSQDNASKCSTAHASYVYVLAPTKISIASSDGNIPVISVSGLIVGGHAQLFSDSACSTSLSKKVSVTTATQNLVTPPLALGTHSIYAKSWDSQDNTSKCSTYYAVYVFKKTPLGRGNLVQISSGHGHNCALTSSGRVKCWGEGNYGQLGNGKTYLHNCHSLYNQALGDGSTSNTRCGTSYPVDVISGKDSTTPLTNIVQISSGAWHTCALTSSGGVKCWGSGGLGYGSTYDTNYPVDVISKQNSTILLSNVVQISSGKLYTCALTSSGGVKCWGYGGNGQLGDGRPSSYSNQYQTTYPVDVISGKNSTTALTNIVQIDAGTSHICALTASGNVECWGGGYRNSTDRNYPIEITSEKNNITPLSNIIQISSGNATTCAITTSREVKCWGVGYAWNSGNTRGTSYPTEIISEKNSTTPLSNIVQINSSTCHACAITFSGNVKCWGYGSCEGVENYPVDVILSSDSAMPLSNIVQISSGYGHYCALTSSGGIKCWGKYGIYSTKKYYPFDVFLESGNRTPFNIGVWKRT